MGSRADGMIRRPWRAMEPDRLTMVIATRLDARGSRALSTGDGAGSGGRLPGPSGGPEY